MVVGYQDAGKAAALGAAFLWALTVTVFTFASRRIGAQVVNSVRLLLALGMLLGLHWIVTGVPWPSGLGTGRTLWLLLSGLVGFSLADGFGLESFLHIGPRLGMLVQTLAPVFAAVLAWCFLGQGLSWAKLGAMLTTLGGIALVVSQGADGGHGRRWLGLFMALGAAMGQAVGQFTALKGMAGGVQALPANLVRLAAGALGAWVFLLWRGIRVPSGSWGDSRLQAQVLAGTIMGPVAGTLLSLYAVTHAPLGVAATLMYLVPVFMLPIARIWFHEPVTVRALGGTLLTVGGASALFLLP